MKIIIIGGGIGGLSAYHALQKHLSSSSNTITLYEAYPSSHSTTTVIGGGLGLQPNGQRAIAMISPAALQHIQSRGHECPSFTFRNERGQTLAVMGFGDKKRHGYGTMMAPRAVVHEGFLADEEVVKGVKWGKRVKDIKELEGKVEVHFEDGDVDSCDLLIGADGVRSVCKEALFGKEYPAEYDGLTGIGGFLPLSSLSPTLQAGMKQDIVTMTYSRSGFFGLALCTPSPTSPSSPPQQVMWWSTYETNPPLARDTLPSRIKDILIARHGGWKSPYDDEDRTVFRDIINLGCTNASQLLILPRYVSPLLPQWSSASNGRGSGRIVLVGDAAHTMPPESGQGASCAIEDGLALALLLKHHLESKRIEQLEAIQKSVIAYEDIRKPRVTWILNYAKRGANSKREMGWLGEKMREWVFWVFSKLPTSILHDKMHGYDVEAEVRNHLTQSKLA